MKFKIMTRQHGDQLQEFKTDDAEAIKAAEDRFRELTGSGFMAWAPSKDGSAGTQVRKFNPELTEVIFQPQLKGG